MNVPIANFISRKKKKKEKRGGHMIKCLLTELGRAGRENIWPSGQIFSRPARPNSVNKYIFFTDEDSQSTLNTTDLNQLKYYTFFPAIM